ncbi:MAG: hypothetical protein EOO63_06530, partial [Hymenobacter sp.]
MAVGSRAVKRVVLPPTRTPSCAWAELASSRPLLSENRARFIRKRKDRQPEEPLYFARVAYQVTRRRADSRIKSSSSRRTCKLHAVVDALGNAVHLALTGGQQAHCPQLPDLLDKLPQFLPSVVADEAYDTNKVLVAIARHEAEAVIPPKANRGKQRPYDENLYADRNNVEPFFGRLKEARGFCHPLRESRRFFLGRSSLIGRANPHALVQAVNQVEQTVKSLPGWQYIAWDQDNTAELEQRLDERASDRTAGKVRLELSQIK